MIQSCHKCGATFTATSAGSREYRLRKVLGDLLGAHTIPELQELATGMELMKSTIPPEDFEISRRAIAVMVESAP